MKNNNGVVEEAIAKDPYINPELMIFQQNARKMKESIVMPNHDPLELWQLAKEMGMAPAMDQETI